MEASHRLDLVTFLLEEAPCKIALLQRAITAHERAWEEHQHTAPGLPRSPEQAILQAEQALWEHAAIPVARIKVLCDPIIRSLRQPVGHLYLAFETPFSD